ncbi:hypothetical protein NA78x_006144 [Anatilimnocola sp. NA78]|uniref:hypothetical protein n=1 Tax=Anatilimnocola sp. NA78 TaxID=3415683 RepID=UPI003CE46F4F
METNPYESPAHDSTQTPVGKSYWVKLTIRFFIAAPILSGALLGGFVGGVLLYHYTNSGPALFIPLLLYAFGFALASVLLAVSLVRWLVVKLKVI